MVKRKNNPLLYEESPTRVNETENKSKEAEDRWFEEGCCQTGDEEGSKNQTPIGQADAAGRDNDLIYVYFICFGIGGMCQYDIIS